MNDLTDKIASKAQQAAREGAPSLLTHAARSQTGEATLTVKLTLTTQGHQHVLAAAWKAAHTDSDAEVLPTDTFDDRQMDMGIK